MTSKQLLADDTRRNNYQDKKAVRQQKRKERQAAKQAFSLREVVQTISQGAKS